MVPKDKLGLAIAIYIAKEIVVAAFSIMFGGVMFALAIAVGLGGRTIAKDLLEERLRRKKVENDKISHI